MGREPADIQVWQGMQMTTRRPFSVGDLPDELREPVERWLQEICELDESCQGQVEALQAQDGALLRLVASSEFAARVLLRDWHWFIRERGRAKTAAELVADLGSDIDKTDRSLAAVKKALRHFRNRELTRILWRSTSGRDDLWASLRSLSELADSLISASMVYAREHLEPRFGHARAADDSEIPLIALAMGKLGGSELNFSSDIDLIFLYTEEGETTGARELSAHEYFTRLSRLVVSLLEEVTEDGFVYRVDTRLRPFGDSGPPVVSFAALESYLLRHGRNWERYAYVKARVISPGASESQVQELQRTMIDPFVYRRYLDYGVFESLRDMKALIEAEVQRRELADNVKLGPGGIREIEFIAQSLQLVRGGSNRNLRCRELRQALAALNAARSLDQESIAVLMEAYEFLRRFENGIQAIRDQQTHDIPDDPADRARLLVVMGQDSWGALLDSLESHRYQVSRQFAHVAFRGDSERGSALKDSLASLWSSSADSAEWAETFLEAGFEEPAELAASITRFRAEPVQYQIDTEARRRLARFVPEFLSMLRERHNAATVCERVITIVSRVLRRSAYVALLNENPAVLERLIVLCGQSAYLASEIARYPLLLDELLDPRLYIANLSMATMRADLDERLARLDSEDSEVIIEALAQFQRAALFRIGVADVSGRLPIMKVSDRLTELAEVVLEKALDMAMTDLVTKHGRPVVVDESGTRYAGFGVVAYGKLGGIELSYGSDLDLVFLHDSVGTNQVTDGAKPLDNTMFFGRLVRRLVHFLTTQTPSGALYEIDTRLRPSGRSGLLVINVDGFEKYQEEHAWTWEHQALLRSRAIAGSPAVAREFERVRTETLCHRVRRDKLLEDVTSMRQKMRRQLDKSDADVFDMKQGRGGIGDIEFLVQYLVLQNAAKQPALIFYSDNIRQLGALEAAGVLPVDDVVRLQEIYRNLRLRNHRLALNGQPSMVPAGEFEEERAFVSAIWDREMSTTP